MSADPPKLRRRHGQLLLAALMVMHLAWDLRAVLADRRLSPTDTTVEEALLLREALAPGGQGVGAWLGEARKGPLAGPVVALADLAVGDPVLAGRLVSVALRCALLALVCLITVRLTRAWGAGLLAVAICGASPMVLGWFRLDYHEPLVAVALLVCLWLMLAPARGWRQAAGLGLALGLGLLAKLSLAVFVSAPLLVLVLLDGRSRGGRRRLALAAGVCLLAIGWWLLPHAAQLWSYLGLSHQRAHETAAARLVIYTWGVPGATPLLAGAALGAIVAWHRRAVPCRALLLLCGSVAGALAWLVLLFDSWPRYLVPALPVAAVLCALGLHAAAATVSPRVARLAALVMAAALLITTGVLNQRGLPLPATGREGGAGMVVADPRPHDAYPRAVAQARRLGGPLVELPGWPRMHGKRALAHPQVWQRRGLTPPRATSAQLVQRLSAGRPAHLVLCHARGDDVLSQVARARPWDHLPAETLAVLRPRKKRVLSTRCDPDGVCFSVVRLQP